MTAEQKDEWILTQASLTSESEQQDFLMSLSGEKKIIYMPALKEIEEFCADVQNGKIYVEYETHYCEFNSEGRYVGDWEVQYNDVQDAFLFLDRVFRGCHDLICLGEYDLAGEIMDKVCRLEFQVEDAEDSEDTGDGEPFSIAAAKKEQLLFTDTRDIGYDWITALLFGKENHEDMEFAAKLVDILNFEMCEKLQLSDFKTLISEKLLGLIEKVLNEKLCGIDMELKKFPDRTIHWSAVYPLEKEKARNEHLLLDIHKECRKQQEEETVSNDGLVLEGSWKQIKELLQILSYEGVIDDQFEIEEVSNICEALIRRGGFENESWATRKKILSDMLSHEYYDCYGCYDALKELSKKLYITDTEILEFADMLNHYKYYAREAANLYRKYGREDKYIQYLQTHLGKAAREYVELIQCYCAEGNEEGARQTAEQGLADCKEDLTDIFIFLLQDAKRSGDEVRYKKFYASAKRRRKADIMRIDKEMLQL